MRNISDAEKHKSVFPFLSNTEIRWPLIFQSQLSGQCCDRELEVSVEKCGASQVAPVLKNPPANAGDKRDAGLICVSERSPGEGHGNLLQYSCLEKSMDREAWQATVHKVTKS